MQRVSGQFDFCEKRGSAHIECSSCNNDEYIQANSFNVMITKLINKNWYVIDLTRVFCPTCREMIQFRGSKPWDNNTDEVKTCSDP